MTTDGQLIENYLKKDDEDSLELLVKRYLPRIFGYIKRFTGNKDDASDITQEVFVKIWKNIRKYDREKNFQSWIFTIAKRTAIDWLRKKKDILLDGEMAESLVDNSLLPLDRLLISSNYQAAVAAFNELPVGYSEILKLHLVNELNFREISEAIKKPLNTVKSRYRRGIAKIKGILAHQK